MRNLIAPAFCALLTGCTLAPVQMEVNPAIAIIEPLAVEGHNPRRSDHPIAFGKWRTATVDESSTRRDSAGFSTKGSGRESIGATKSSQAYRFELKSGVETVFTECRSERHSLSVVRTGGKQTDVTEVFAPNRPVLECALSGATEGSLKLTSITSLTTERETGEILVGNSKWTIRSVNHFQGERIAASGARYGYEILNGGQYIGAVETVNQGRVWIDPSLTSIEQDRLAVVSAALLLYEPQKLDIDNDF